MALGSGIALVLALSFAPGEVRRETWPGGQPRAEYSVELRDGRESREGECRTWHENGQLASEGSFANDAETGRWTFQHPDGSRAAQGSFARGERTGPWETFHPGGAPESKGRYVKGARSGEWKFWKPDGSLDALHSGRYEPVARQLPDGRTLAGQTLDGLRHGSWTSTWPDGAPQFEGTFERGARTGTWRMREPGGALAPAFSGLYRAGRREAPLPPEESAERAAPEILPGPSLSEEEARAIRGEIEAWLGADERQRSELANALLQRRTHPTWLRAGMRSLPLVLERMRACDPDSAADRAALGLLEGLFLRKLCGGHALVPLPLQGLATAAEARALVRAWATLWAATSTDPWFWRVELPSTPLAGDDGLLREAPFQHVFGEDAGPRPALLARRFEPRSGPNEAPLQAALTWLERSQRADGSWAVSFAASEVAPPHHHHETGVSALALLALLGAGRDPRDSAAIANALGSLLELQDEATGRIGELESFDWFYTHAIATLALAEVQLLRPSAALRARLQRAVNLVFAARNPYGAWRYELPPTGDNDTSVTAWAATALFLAREAGCEGDFEDAFQGALAWLDEVADRASGHEGYSAFGEYSSRSEHNQEFPREDAEALTAAALFVRRLLGQPVDDPLVARQTELVRRTLPRWDPEGKRVDEYWFYYGAQALALCDPKAADPWAPATRAIALAQSGNAAVRGSWDPVGVWAYTGGRVYSTAMLALMLEAPVRYTLADANDKKKRGR